MEQIILNEICNLLIQQASIVSIPISQRKKWEGWLKIELAHCLQNRVQNVAIEYLCQGSLVDVAIKSGAYLVELKTPNTNYRVPNVANASRPITKNIDGIIKDIQKLRAIKGANQGIIAFVLFPIGSTSSYTTHINKILGQNLTHVHQQMVNVGGVDVFVFVARV